MVISNENRESFPITVDQNPSVTTALEEILNQRSLMNILEAVIGEIPAIVEFTAITAAFGALDQHGHPDGKNYVLYYCLRSALLSCGIPSVTICVPLHSCE